MNTADVPMEPASSTHCPAENPSIPMIQEVAASVEMGKQDHDIQCSDLGSAQYFQVHNRISTQNMTPCMSEI